MVVRVCSVAHVHDFAAAIGLLKLQHFGLLKSQAATASQWVPDEVLS